jgi:hypothetical protein
LCAHPQHHQDSRSGKTLISGGQYIPASAFKALDTSTALGARIPVAARSHVKQANLTQLGLNATQIGTLLKDAPGMELFFKGEALHLARWPNYQNYVLTGNLTANDGALCLSSCAPWRGVAWPVCVRAHCRETDATDQQRRSRCSTT